MHTDIHRTDLIIDQE